MAATGFSRVLTNRHFEDYRSMKQYYNGRLCKEFIISGHGNSSAAGEFEFASEDTDYIGTAAQAYIRVEGVDATQDGKYVYLIYCTETGVIKGPVTADIAATETDEVAIGSTDFWRVREMWSEVECGAAGLMIMLTDADMGGGDNWAYIDDLNSRWASQRYFVPSATQVEHSYLGRVVAQAPQIAAAAAAVDAIILTVTYTPKVISNVEDSAASDLTTTLTWNKELDWQPCIELEPATEVTFSWTDTTTGQAIWFEADFLEVYIKTQPTA